MSSALSFLRGVLTLTGQPMEDYLQPNLLQSVSLLAYVVIYLAATLGIMWMEIRRLQIDLIDLASTDGLTGILNRRAFLDALEREISRCRRSGETLALAMFDPDHFKRINDRHGHPAGDKVLRAFADTLRSVVRPHDLFGRYGGEEFTLLMPGTGKAAAAAIAERCRRAIAGWNLELAGVEIDVTVSAGVAVFDEDAGDAEALISASDAALYQAKKTGRDRVVTTTMPDR